MPAELLEAPADPEDLDDDGMPWWLSLPTDPALDSPIELGPEAAPVAIPTRPRPRYRIEVAGDPEDQADGFNVVDSTTGYPVRWERWFADARRIADELELHTPRSRASNWNPERDAAGLD